MAKRHVKRFVKSLLLRFTKSRYKAQEFAIDGEFVNRGCRWGVIDALGADWLEMLDEMNEVLVV